MQGAQGSVPGQPTRSSVPKLRILQAATETQCSQMFKRKKKKREREKERQTEQIKCPKQWAAAESGPGHLHSVSSQLCLLGNFLFEPLDSGRDRAGEGALPGRPEEGDSRHPEG